MKIIVLLMAIVFSLNANAFRGKDQTGLNIGSFSEIECSLNLDCDKESGALKVANSKTVSVSAASTLAKDDCGSIQIGLANVSFTLPDSGDVFGCKYTFVNGDGSNLYVNPEADDQLRYIANNLGDGVLSTTRGDSLTILSISVDEWAVIGISSLTNWIDADEN